MVTKNLVFHINDFMETRSSRNSHHSRDESCNISQDYDKINGVKECLLEMSNLYQYDVRQVKVLSVKV